MESSHLLDGLWHLELADARLVMPSTPILDDFSAELDTSHLAPAGADTDNVDWFHDLFASLDTADVDNVNWLSDLFSHLEAPNSTPAPTVSCDDRIPRLLPPRVDLHVRHDQGYMCGPPLPHLTRQDRILRWKDKRKRRLKGRRVSESHQLSSLGRRRVNGRFAPATVFLPATSQ